ncbi:DUF58 domain-containing protein [Roseitranquillus sediminis]|uniref:DUF58 domain-containing protein n=1 Tax=Roseitranquillus sediminis TaxID=2809051 RepID=UPI001D0C2F23|nr:DUF58 domain-containing protein [Roseitranquillus sediminis]MBM9594844.1 DUF58 domain-containing protein [Roseitranquillus sediminis]
MSEAAQLRGRAEALAAPLPPLLAAAEHLAATVLLGSHGRRRAGVGDEFWQYRPAHGGDEARFIDWRRSGRSDAHYVREREWQAAQSIVIWVDRSQSMRFASTGRLPAKADRAAMLAMALSVLLIRGGERVGLSGTGLPPRSGEVQLMRLAATLSEAGEGDDYGAPEVRGMLPQSRALYVSDFLGDPAPVEAALTRAADRGVKGALLQVLDPQEEAFPFDGRTIFESIGGTIRHETLKAGDLRNRYIERLKERKARLSMLARTTGWQFHTHHTDDAPSSALLWLYGAMERVH